MTNDVPAPAPLIGSKVGSRRSPSVAYVVFERAEGSNFPLADATVSYKSQPLVAFQKIASQTRKRMHTQL